MEIEIVMLQLGCCLRCAGKLRRCGCNIAQTQNAWPNRKLVGRNLLSTFGPLIPATWQRSQTEFAATNQLWNIRSSTCRVATLLAMMSHEAGHNAKLPCEVNVGAKLRKRKAHCKIESLSGETGCLLAPLPDPRLLPWNQREFIYMFAVATRADKRLIKTLVASQARVLQRRSLVSTRRLTLQTCIL